MVIFLLVMISYKLQHIDMNEKEMMNRIASGDRLAFRELLDRYVELVFRTSYRILCDRKDAEDVTEAVFKRILHKASRYPERISLNLWILRHVCRIARFRITRRRVMYLFGIRPDIFFTSAPRVTDHDDYITQQAWEIYCRAAMKLSPMQMILYSLSVLEQLSYSEVYHVTGLPRILYKWNLKVAHKKIRSELKRYGKVR